jgi:hypothetical protein
VKSFLGLLTTLFIIASTSNSCRKAALGEYLKGNQLIEPIEIVELQGGVVGFTGTYYTIEKDGNWTTGPVLPGKGEKGVPTDKGRLTSEQLVQLSKQLHKYKLSNLPSHGASAVNPHVVKIKLGQMVKVLNPDPGDTSKEDDQSIRDRYKGILNSVKSLCTAPYISP